MAADVATQIGPRTPAAQTAAQTAPLPALAAAALERLERAFATNTVKKVAS